MLTGGGIQHCDSELNHAFLYSDEPYYFVNEINILTVFSFVFLHFSSALIGLTSITAVCQLCY